MKVLAHSDLPTEKPGVDEPRRQRTVRVSGNDAGSLAFKALLDDTKGPSSEETLSGEVGEGNSDTEQSGDVVMEEAEQVVLNKRAKKSKK